ncbi:MAG TPA: hypothetical protein VH596_08190 [Terriglobales bacterium]|jgi:hypothetical protein
MKSANDVLRQKEADLARVRHEVNSLKIVAALLADDGPDVDELNQTSDGAGGNLLISEEEEIDAPAEATGTDGLLSSFSHQRRKRWNVLKRHT